LNYLTRSLFVLLFTISLYLCSGCNEDSTTTANPPEILSVSADQEIVYTGDIITVSCESESETGIDVRWSTRGGEILGSYRDFEITWRAPEFAGQYQINIRLEKDGLITKDSLILQVSERDITEQEFMLNNSGISITMVRIEPGSFMMGAPGTAGAGDDESPSHLVTISKAFWISKYEVTQSPWKAVITKSNFSFRGDNLPADNVSWYETHDFLDTLNNYESDDKWRLPSEAEWEYCARAGHHDTRFWYGNDLDYSLTDDYSWTVSNSFERTHNVGTTPAGVPNPFGLWDMGGNVWEWCEDWYHWGYVGAPDDESPWIDPSGDQRVMRGGSFYETARQTLPNLKSLAPPYAESFNIGFRIVRDVD
jgi:formylglycine-generating enzyme required for sulfatase activity